MTTPRGAPAPDESVGESVTDGASTGTDHGPAGIPAALVGHDSDGDLVPPPPAAGPGDLSTSSGPAEESDELSPTDSAPPQQVSGGSGESGTGDAAPPGVASGDGPPLQR